MEAFLGHIWATGNGDEMFQEHLCRFHGVSGHQDSDADQYLNNSEYREKMVQQTISRENWPHKESYLVELESCSKKLKHGKL